MLELKPTCENCNKPLAYNAADAMICSFECTFCEDCVTKVLHNVCPNCGGGFERRPVRPKKALEKYPASVKETYRPVQTDILSAMQEKYEQILPHNRI